MAAALGIEHLPSQARAKTRRSAPDLYAAMAEIGSVMLIRTIKQSSGPYYREYEQTVTTGGKMRRSYGTACRQPIRFLEMPHQDH